MWCNRWEFLVHYSLKEGSDFIILKLESEKSFIGRSHTLVIIQFSLSLKCLGYLPVVTVLCINVVYTSRKKIQLGFFLSLNNFSSFVNFVHSHLNEYSLFCSRRTIFYPLLCEPSSLHNTVLWREIYFRSPKASRKRAVVLCCWTVIRDMVCTPEINKYYSYIYRFIKAASFFNLTSHHNTGFLSLYLDGMQYQMSFGKLHLNIEFMSLTLRMLSIILLITLWWMEFSF